MIDEEGLGPITVCKVQTSTLLEKELKTTQFVARNLIHCPITTQKYDLYENEVYRDIKRMSPSRHNNTSMFCFKRWLIKARFRLYLFDYEPAA
jgi:hypothetical protein